MRNEGKREGRDGSESEFNESSKLSNNLQTVYNQQELNLRSVDNNGVFPTYFIFLDLPKHIEFRSQNLPVLKEGTEMDFDFTIRNPRDPRRSKKILGTHVISRCLLKYGGKHPGITQYLEWKSVRS